MVKNTEDSSSQENTLRDNKIAWLLREGALKEWSVTLSAYLEHFHNYTVSSKEVNFTEVAMLLQNTTSCYSKRVDNVHKTLVAFVDSLIKDAAGNQDGKGGSSGNSRGKSSKTLIRDNLEVLPFVVSETLTRLDLKQYISTQEPVKTIVFPNPQITSRKSGLSRTLFDISGKEIGTKDDFGLFGKMSSSGYLGDFDFSTFAEESASECFEDDSDDVIQYNDMDNGTAQTVVSLLNGMDFEDNNTVSELQPSVEDNDNIPDDDLAQQGLISPDSCDEAPPSPIQNTITLGGFETHVEKCRATKNTKKQKESWEPIAVNESRIPASKPIKVCNILIVPDSVASSNEYKQRETICGRRRNRKVNSKRSNYECQGFPSFVQWAASRAFKTMNAEEIAVLKERRKKNKLIKKMMAKDDKPPAEEFFPGDMDDQDMDDFDDGNALLDGNSSVGFSEMNAVQQSEGGNTADLVPTTYEEDAIAVIKKFQESRQAYAANSVEITKRVDQWHEKIRSILEKAEARNAYDSHEYGTIILKNLTEKSDRDFVPFGEAIGEQSSVGEVGRYFLSTLMLANTYNIEIKNDGGGLQTDCMNIKLLTETRHHEQMDEAFKVL